MITGLIAATFFICFYHSWQGAIWVGIISAAGTLLSLWQPAVGPALPLIISLGLLLLGHFRQQQSWAEALLSGGLWLIAHTAARLLPHALLLQELICISAFTIILLAVIKRLRLPILVLILLAAVYLLDMLLGPIHYAKEWQGEVIAAALFVISSGGIIFTQLLCCRQALRTELSATPIFAARRQMGWEKLADEETRRLQIFEHDFRHHLDAVSALYESGHGEEARAYVEDMKQARVSGKGRRGGNEQELSYILMAKKQECRDKDITFTYQIVGSPKGIAEMDLSTLLLNLVSNAIRACEEVKGSRSISLMLLERGELWEVEMVNSGRYEPGENRESKDGLRHGIGMVSVQQIVQRYEGTYQLWQEEDQVVQKLILVSRETE